MTALSIGLGLASGLGVLGLQVSPGQSSGVLFVTLEDDQEEFHRRLNRGIELLAEDPRWTPAHLEALKGRMVPVFPDRATGEVFSLQDQWQALAAIANAIPGGCGLIVLDTLARLNLGDENAARDTRGFVEAWSALAQQTGAAPLAIHHLTKGNDSNSDRKLFQRLHPEALRGSSAIEGAARFVLQMAALSPSEAQTAGLEADRALRGAYVALHLSKTNATEKGETILLERRQEGEPGAGFLSLHPDSERAIATIQGVSAMLKFNREDKVLLAVAEAGGSLAKLDKEKEARVIFPDGKTPSRLWDKAISALRKNGWVDQISLTDTGWAKAQTLGFNCSDRNKPESIKSGNSHTFQGVPPQPEHGGTNGTPPLLPPCSMFRSLRGPEHGTRITGTPVPLAMAEPEGCL